MDLLSIIAGQDTEGLFEVRCRNPRNGRIGAREWFSVSDWRSGTAEVVELLDGQPTLSNFAREHAAKFDVYVGAAPRTMREGGKNAIAQVWCLWADCDTPEAIERLKHFRPKPGLIIGSGNGQHAWWPLSHPLSPVWAVRANRRLAHALGADIKATDAARILRYPGTLNHKTDPPMRVMIEKGIRNPRADFALPVAAIVGGLSDPPGTAKPRKPRPDVISDDPLLGISAGRYYQTLTGRKVTQGNVTCPFHSGGKERSPSMRLYDTTWYCWGCTRGGSIYEFGSMLWGLDTRGTAFLELKERLTHALA